MFLLKKSTGGFFGLSSISTELFRNYENQPTTPRTYVVLGNCRAVDPDPDLHGSAFIFPPGSGSAFNMRIRIQEGKYVN